MSEAMGTQDYAAWAANVVAARRDQHMTQDHLAQAAGVSLSGVRRAERSGFVGPETIRALCAALNIEAPRTMPLSAHPNSALSSTNTTQKRSKIRAVLENGFGPGSRLIKKHLGHMIGVLLVCGIFFWVGVRMCFFFSENVSVAQNLSTAFETQCNLLIAHSVQVMSQKGAEFLEAPPTNPRQDIHQGISQYHVPYLFLGSAQDNADRWFEPFGADAAKRPSSKLIAYWESIIHPRVDGVGSSLMDHYVVPHIEGLNTKNVWFSIGPMSASSCRYAIHSLTPVTPLDMVVAFGPGRAWPKDGWGRILGQDPSDEVCSDSFGTLHILLTKSQDLLQGNFGTIAQPVGLDMLNKDIQ